MYLALAMTTRRRGDVPAVATSTRRRADVPGSLHEHKKKSRCTWQSPQAQEEEQVYLAVSTRTRRRAGVPGSLHKQDLGLEAGRGPLGRLQPSVSDSGHVVFGPWLIGDVVHHRHFLHTKIVTRKKEKRSKDYAFRVDWRKA